MATSFEYGFLLNLTIIHIRKAHKIVPIAIIQMGMSFIRKVLVTIVGNAATYNICLFR